MISCVYALQCKESLLHRTYFAFFMGGMSRGIQVKGNCSPCLRPTLAAIRHSFCSFSAQLDQLLPTRLSTARKKQQEDTKVQQGTAL
jgi:hypothetical protein